MSVNLSSHFPGGFSRAVTPQMDRRAYADRRTPLKPMPITQRSWAKQIVVAGCIGAVLGSTGAFGVLAQLQSPLDPHAASLPQPEASVPAAAIMAPLFDTAPFVAQAPLARPDVPRAAAVAHPNRGLQSDPQSGRQSERQSKPQGGSFGELSGESSGTSGESYSEDAAGVPSATYHEPPKSAGFSALDDR